MEIKELIVTQIKKQKQLRASEIIKQTGFSRTYVNRAFQELRDEGKILLIGKANRAVYVLAEKEAISRAKKPVLKFRGEFVNKEISEETILKEVKDQTGIFFGLKHNVEEIINYVFLEMANNAIEHSRSPVINVTMERGKSDISFTVADSGVGIFNNIKKKFKLPDTLSAVQLLLKGKQTTAPKQHTGQGIFFSSKIADSFLIKSSGKKVRFINTGDVNDIFLEDAKAKKGTIIFFVISKDSRKRLKDVFVQYTEKDTFEFSKTKVAVSLYKISRNLLSRSEARRVAMGLEDFKEIVLDFKHVETVGQGFADEIFRVWQTAHPKKKIIYINANENVEFMIKRV
ncbi:MAG: DUF4325 domain-containing protein [Patescibacteria group bacterium]